MFAKIKNWILSLNEEGVPLPLLRDPKAKTGSVTLTMFWISFNIAILTLAGKITKVIGDVDYSNVLWLLGLTGSFYLGRRIQGDGKNMSLEGNAEESKEKDNAQSKEESEPPV